LFFYLEEQRGRGERGYKGAKLFEGSLAQSIFLLVCLFVCFGFLEFFFTANHVFEGIKLHTQRQTLLTDALKKEITSF